MQNIVLLSMSEAYSYHKEICKTLQSLSCFKDYNFHHIDITEKNIAYISFSQIKQLLPTYVITLDLAGFCFYTQLGRISLNLLPAKILNLVWGNKSEYSYYLSQPLSLSMHFFDCAEHPYNIKTLYPYVEYYNYLAPVFTTEKFCENNSEALLQIAECFLAEVEFSTKNSM